MPPTPFIFFLKKGAMTRKGRVKAELCVAVILVIALHVQMVLNSAPALDSSRAACCKRPIRCFPAVLTQRSRAGVYSHFCIAVPACRIV